MYTYYLIINNNSSYSINRSIDVKAGPCLVLIPIFLICVVTVSAQPADSVDTDIIANQSRKQISFYLNGITTGYEVPFNFWALKQLGESNESIHTFINRQSDSLLQNMSIHGIQLDLLENLSDSQSVSTSLLRLAQKTGYVRYFFAGISQMPDTVRRKQIVLRYIANNDSISTQHSLISAYIRLAAGDTTALSTILKPHPFRFVDLFIFDFWKPQKQDYADVQKLIEYWLSDINDRDDIKQALELTVVVHAKNIMKDYASIYNFEIGRLKILPATIRTYNFYNRIAYSNYYLGYLQKSVPIYKNILYPISTFLRDSSIIFQTQLYLGLNFFQLGQINKAQKEWNLIVSNSSATTNKYYLWSLADLAITYHRTGDFDKYIKTSLKVLNKTIADKNYKLEMLTLRNLAVYYRGIGNWSAAVTYLNEAYKLARKTDDLSNLGSIKEAEAYFNWKYKHNYTRSDSLYNQVKLIADSLNDYRLWLTATSDQAHAYLQQKKYNSAIRVYNDLIKRAISNSDQKSELSNKIELAVTYLKNDNFQTADSLYGKIKNGDFSLLDFSTIVKKTNLQAQILIHQGNVIRAQNLLAGIATQILDRARNSANIQSGYLRLEDEDKESLGLLINLYLNRGENQKALLLMDNIKTLNKAAFYNNILLQSKFLSEDQIVEDQQLSHQIEKDRSDLMSANAKQRTAILTDLANAQTEKKELEQKVLHNYDNTALNLPRLRQRLTPRQGILYFTLLDHHLYESLITDNEMKFHRILITDTTIDSINNEIRMMHKGDTHLRFMKKIHDLLFSSLDITNFKKLYVIPDGFLYQINLGVLPVSNVVSDHSYGAAHYMIENHTFSYYTSLKDLERSLKPPPRQTYALDFLGFGISNFNGINSTLTNNKSLLPLPYTKVEVTKIDSLLPSSAKHKKIFLGDQSSKAVFRKWLPKARIVHLATHSEVYYREPLFSVIYLNNGNKMQETPKTNNNNGLIHAYELFEMNLTNRMIMLSSCESGAGDYITGSGVIGLSRAFSYAGARSLVLNLWQIKDKTAEEISVRFYSYLKEGYSKDKAMQLAKLYELNNGNSNPYQWGSFVVTGDVSSLYPNKFQLFVDRYIAAPSLIILLIGLLVYKRKNRS